MFSGGIEREVALPFMFLWALVYSFLVLWLNTQYTFKIYLKLIKNNN